MKSDSTEDNEFLESIKSLQGQKIANSLMEDAEAKASNRREAKYNTRPSNQSEILEQLLPALVSMHQIQHHILQISCKFSNESN